MKSVAGNTFEEGILEKILESSKIDLKDEVFSPQIGLGSDLEM
jgi:hypothetical protein